MCHAVVGSKKLFVVVRGRKGVWGGGCFMSVSPKVITILSNPDVAFNGAEPRTAET
jgi:hypothetical protein